MCLYKHVIFYRSLYIFLMQAKAYSEIEDSSLAVSVSGDVGEAKTFQSCQQDKSGEVSPLPT